MKTTIETTVTEWEHDNDGQVIKETKIVSTQEKED
jgi:hypothetical protein